MMSDHTGIEWARTTHGGRTSATYTEAPVNMGRNLRNVWTIATQPFPDAHFATFPESLAETCIKAGCPAGGMVLDPFGGSGTTGLVADRLGRNAILIELNREYAAMARHRIGLFAELAMPGEAVGRVHNGMPEVAA